MRRMALILCLIALVPNLPAKTRKNIPAAPLPAEIINAKRIFLSNGGGCDPACDAFYAAMKKWGEYQIVGSLGEADLIVELSYQVENMGTRMWSATNTYNNTTQVYSRQVVDPKLILTIYDAKTKNSLWSTVNHRQLARLEKNREKETINSAEGRSCIANEGNPPAVI